MKKENKDIKFSVIVPIYKVEKFLPKCIESILQQTYANFELILIDDGSPDNCPQICDEYAEKDNRIKVIHKSNGGLVSARNIGIKQATGNYICYVDGDDWIVKETLYKINKIIEKYSDIDMIVFNLERIFKDSNEKIEFYVEPGLYNKDKLEKEIYPYLMYDNRKPFCVGTLFPAACNKIYKTELLKEHYCSDERIKMGEDNAFTYECALYSNNIYFLNDILYEYNQLNETSFANSYDENRFKNNQLLTSYIEGRIGNLNDNMEYQVNAFKAYWLFMTVFHEIKCKKNFMDSRKHISKEIKETKVTSNIKMKGLPLFAKCYLLLLKFHMYGIALLGAKVIVEHKKGNGVK